jgi:hypothetical protein
MENRVVSERLEEDRAEYQVMVAGLREASGWPKLLLPWIQRRYDRIGIEPPTLPMEDDLLHLVERWGNGAWSAVKVEGRDA